MKINLPNQITIGRLVLAVVFFILLCRFSIRQSDPGLMDLCLVVFIVAGLTDWLDGYVARKTNQVTSLGRILDPFVDKVLVCGAFVIFTGPAFVEPAGTNVTGVAPWMVVVILARELLVTGLRGFSESRGEAFGADVWGKVKTWAQMITACGIMIYLAHGKVSDPGSALGRLSHALVWITVAVTTLSGLNYLRKAGRLLNEHGTT